MKPNDASRATAEAMPAICDQTKFDLESALHELRNMADITAKLVEDAISGSHEKVTGHPNKYHLTPRECDRILFAAYHTENLAARIIATHGPRAAA